jgi:hypothetical protein
MSIARGQASRRASKNIFKAVLCIILLTTAADIPKPTKPPNDCCIVAKNQA